MPAYLITYDLNRETKRPNITKKIRDGFPSWARLSESSYAVSTTLTANGVYEYLKPLLDDNDHIYIITLKKPWMGFGPKDVNDWLDSNLPY